MRQVTTLKADCISCYREELMIYLVQRFGSLSFAQRIFAETQRRFSDSSVLDCVGNPHIYLISYALSLGLELMHADQNHNRGDTQLEVGSSSTPDVSVHQAIISGGEPWHAQPISTLH